MKIHVVEDDPRISRDSARDWAEKFGSKTVLPGVLPPIPSVTG